MPIYEYECCNCKAVFEHIHGIKEDAKTELFCPDCNTVMPVRRLVSTSNFKCFGKSSPFTPKGSRQSKVREINGQLYDRESYEAKKTHKRIPKGTTIRRS